MILLPLDNPILPASAPPQLPAALDAIRSLPPDAPDGRVDLAEGMYLVVSRYATSPAAEKPYEAHRRYVDVQALLAGREIIGLAKTDDLTERTAYDPQSDAAFYDAPPGEHSLELRPGWAMVFAPADAHRPGCCCSESAEVCKVVVKIPVSG
jgi:YhcH/YjgK/YiaL family protein